MDTNAQSISTVVIAAAGKGTRMGMFTSSHPKCLVPLLGTPLLRHILDSLHAQGFTRIIVVVEHFAEQVQSFISHLPYPVECVQQSLVVGHKYGTAAVMQAVFPLVNTEPVLLYSGDSLFHKIVLERLLAESLTTTLCASKTISVLGYGEVHINETHNLTTIEEKPVNDHPGLINAGLYILTPDLYPYIEQLEPSIRGEYELTDAISAFAGSHPVRVELIDEHEWTTVTRESDISYAEEYVKRS